MTASDTWVMVALVCRVLALSRLRSAGGQPMMVQGTMGDLTGTGSLRPVNLTSGKQLLAAENVYRIHARHGWEATVLHCKGVGGRVVESRYFFRNGSFW